jgi:hypothetical protein
MMKILSLNLVIGAALLAAGCTDNVPLTARNEIYSRNHVQFANIGLRDRTRLEPVQATQDPSGILHVSINIRNTSDSDVYVDGFITFTRNGNFVEKLGPKPIMLRNNLPDVIEFNSTQPADDFLVSLDYAK